MRRVCVRQPMPHGTAAGLCSPQCLPSSIGALLEDTNTCCYSDRSLKIPQDLPKTTGKPQLSHCLFPATSWQRLAKRPGSFLLAFPASTFLTQAVAFKPRMSWLHFSLPPPHLSVYCNNFHFSILPCASGKAIHFLRTSNGSPSPSTRQLLAKIVKILTSAHQNGWNVMHLLYNTD